MLKAFFVISSTLPLPQMIHMFPVPNTAFCCSADNLGASSITGATFFSFAALSIVN
jgi:hypothetical protein